MILQMKKHAHTLFYILLAVLIALLFVRYAMQLSIPRILLTAIVMLIALCSDRNEILAIAICCIPLHNAVNLYVSIGFCTAVYLLKELKNIKIGIDAVLIFMIIVWEILHCFDNEFSIKLFVVSIIPFIFVMVVLSVNVRDLDYVFIFRTMAIMEVIICIVLLVNLFIKADFSISETFLNLKRLGMLSENDSIFGSAINPNSLGVINVLSLTAILQFYTMGQHKKVDLLLAFSLVILGGLTTSRTFLVCLALLMLLFMIGQQGSLKKKIKTLIFIGFFCICIVLLLNKLAPNLVEYYIHRFSSYDITSGRNNLFLTYNEFISSNLNVMFWGLGLNNITETLTMVYQVANNVPHNCIQEIIIIWGFLGLILISFWFLAMLYKSKKFNSNKILLNYIPLLIILAKSMVGQMLTSGYTILALSFAYLSLCQVFKSDNIYVKK